MEKDRKQFVFMGMLVFVLGLAYIADGLHAIPTSKDWLLPIIVGSVLMIAGLVLARVDWSKVRKEHLELMRSKGMSPDQTDRHRHPDGLSD